MDLPTAEAQLRQRLAQAMANAKLDPGTASPLPGFQGPFLFALSYCGVTPADPTAVTSADVANLSPGDWVKFLDIAAARLVFDVALAFTTGLQRVETPDFTKQYDLGQLQKLVRMVQDQVKVLYGVGLPVLGEGTIQTNVYPPADRF